MINFLARGSPLQPVETVVKCPERMKKLYELRQTFFQLVLGDYKDCKDPLHTCDTQMKIPNVFNFKCKKILIILKS